MQITLGSYRKLTKDERERYPDCKYAIVSEYKLQCLCRNWMVVVPVGFVCDGSTGGPDCGVSWIFHDWLYANQHFSNGIPCDRKAADQIMACVLRHERRYLYWLGYKLALRIFRAQFREAWEKGAERAARILGNDDDTE